jgi:hypothetical protein
VAGEPQFGDKDYEALGRYVTKFSELIAEMRNAMARKLSQPKRTYELAQLVLAESTAAPIASSFFAMCVHVGWIDWNSPDGKDHESTQRPGPQGNP